MKKTKKVTAEDVLSEFIKGEIVRDYNKRDRLYYTCSLDTALRAMRKFAKLKMSEQIDAILTH